MNKIFLILVLIASGYGQAFMLLGTGSTNCSEFLDNAEEKDSISMGLYGSFAQGVFTTMNMSSEAGVLPYKEGIEFSPNTPTLRRVVMRFCDENLTMNYHQALINVWAQNAK